MRRMFCVAALVAIGCGGAMTVNGITLHRYGQMDGGPAALTEGTLRIRDGCVSIEYPSLERSTILWPPGTNLTSVGGRPGVVIGSATASDGDDVILDGGEYTDATQRAFVEGLAGPLGACVSERYWLATGMRVGERAR